MIELSRFRRVLPFVASLAVAGWIAATLLASPAAAFKVEKRGTAGLDGKVVMSPAAERIETVRPDGGEQVGPGSVIKRNVIIHNRSKDPIEFDLDVAQVVGSTAELIVEVRHGVREGAAAWVTLEKSSFRLAPGDQGTVGLTIRVPETIKPGSKPFAVTATQRSQPTQTQGAGIAPQFKQVGIFIVELPGDAPIKGNLTKATITSSQKNIEATREGKKVPENARFYVGPSWFKSHRLTLSTEYENDGERLLTPSGRVVVRDIFNRVVGRYEIKKFTVYPGGESAGQVELKGLPALGIFTAKVELESEAAGKQSTTLPRFVQLPKWFVSALGAFAIWLASKLLKRYLARRREWKRYLAAEESGEGGEWVEGDGEVDAADDEQWDYAEEPDRV
ncbi:MAG: hypothetical protein JWM86_2654 [Thermoleophilia bacterium]|nr:hypothetical protein [Thermoleophilia bacterium]